MNLKLEGTNKYIYDYSEHTNKWDLTAPFKKHLIDTVIKILKNNKNEIQ